MFLKCFGFILDFPASKNPFYIDAIRQCLQNFVYKILYIRKDPKPYFNVCKTLFTNKHNKNDMSIVSVEKDELILSEKKIAL